MYEGEICSNWMDVTMNANSQKAPNKYSKSPHHTFWFKTLMIFIPMKTVTPHLL